MVPSFSQVLWGNERNCIRSGLPSRVLFLSRPVREGYHCPARSYIWEDFPALTVDLFQTAFQARKPDKLPRILVRIDHARSMVDFTSMLMFDQKTACTRSIAWMDIHGQWFFPTHRRECGMCNGGTQGMVTGPSFHVLYRPEEQNSGPFYPPLLPDLNSEPPEWWYES